MPFQSELVEGCRPSDSANAFTSDGAVSGTAVAFRSFFSRKSLSLGGDWEWEAAPKYIQPDTQLDTASVFPDEPSMTAESFVKRLRSTDGLGTTFDTSQRCAIAAALQQRVAVIQGPPGTGKSFVGRELACMLVQLHSPILVITYKNHALDEFLEGCIERVGLASIARLGSRSKSLHLVQRNVKALLRSRTLTSQVVSKETEDGVRELRVLVQELVPRLTELMAQRRSAAFITKDSALAAFLAEAGEELLRQMWLDPSHGLDEKEHLLLQELEGMLASLAPDVEDHEAWAGSFREACTYCVLTEQMERHLDKACRVVLRWDTSLVEIDTKMQPAVTKLSRKMVKIFTNWVPPASRFESIQRRVRPVVLPNAIATTEVDASGLSQAEATDMADATDVTARRTMAEEDHSKSYAVLRSNMANSLHSSCLLPCPLVARQVLG